VTGFAPPAFFAEALKFRGAALEVQSYRGLEWILSGPSETGKTVAALWLLDSLLRTTPLAQAALLRKVQTSIWGTVHVTWKRIQELRTFLGEAPVDTFGGEQPQFYRYQNGARLWIGGFDNPGKALSGERDWVYVNQAEELSEDDWQVLTTRATGRGAVTATPMVFGDCNPSDENHWILRRTSLKLFKSEHKDNPTLFDDDGKLTAQGVRTMGVLNALKGTLRKRLRDGIWCGVEGQFFEEWDEDRHTFPVNPKQKIVIPGDWPIWGALDYGYTHPTAFGFFTEDNDGRVLLLGEHVRNKWLPPLHCKAIRLLAASLGISMHRIRQIVAGHDCFQQRGDENALTIADQYAKAKDPVTGEIIGLKLEKANVDRVTGSQEIQGRLGLAELGVPPRLLVASTCRRVIAAMSRVVGDPLLPEAYEKLNANALGEGGDDEVDMVRYGVMAAKPKPRAGSGRTIGLG